MYIYNHIYILYLKQFISTDSLYPRVSSVSLCARDSMCHHIKMKSNVFRCFKFLGVHKFNTHQIMLNDAKTGVNILFSVSMNSANSVGNFIRVSGRYKMKT